MQQFPVIIYTDGSCSGNPGPGGWAAIIRHSDDKAVEIVGGENLTTNNRMELMAAILSLSYVQENLEYWSSVEIYTDSQYVRNGITSWIASWKRNGWKTAAKTNVKNVDLWMQLDKINTLISPQWKWVKGHAGDEYNEKCNQLAIDISKQYKDKSLSQIY